MERTNKRLSAQCDEIIGKYRLLDHPFYQAWNNGTLPTEALRSYATEYGAFISGIEQGWRTLGKPEIAEHETVHARIWNDSFAAALNTSVKKPKIAEVTKLIDASAALFADKASALGALYCFESQQPDTSVSKLKGLEEHYSDLPAKSGDYFRIHSADYGEVSVLTEMMESDVDQNKLLGSCETMAKALYDALTGIYEPFSATCGSH